MKALKRYKADEIIDFKWRKIIKKYFELPGGKKGEFIVDSWGHDNVAVVALTREKKVVVAKQFRAGPEKILYELPGGACDEGESPDKTALRELQEETGYVSSQEPIFLGEIVRHAYHENRTFYYLLLECTVPRDFHRSLDDYEDIEVELHELEDMIEYAKRGLVGDTAALLFAKERLRGR